MYQKMRDKGGVRSVAAQIEDRKRKKNYVEITAKEWEDAMSQGNGTRPEMKECPYHVGPLIPDFKFDAHLENCRANYREQVWARGGTVNPRSCTFNHNHQVLQPELHWHEKNCPDRHHIPSYMLYINPWFEPKLDYDLRDYEFDPEELARMRDGLYINRFVGGANIESHLNPVPFEDIAANPDIPTAFPTNCMPGKGPVEKKGFSNPFEWEDFPVGGLRPQQSQAEMEGVEGGDTDDLGQAVALPDNEVESTVGAVGSDSNSNAGKKDDENKEDDEKWWNADSGMRFDYMQYGCNPQKPMLKYPPGLTKGQRRKFIEWNSEWMRRIVQHRLAEAARQEGAANLRRKELLEQGERDKEQYQAVGEDGLPVRRRVKRILKTPAKADDNASGADGGKPN